MSYRCVATSLEGFIFQLAVSYISRGYFFYVTGVLSGRKPPEAVDERIISRYGITEKKWKRAERKKAGLSNLQYIRHGNFFVILETRGKPQLLRREGASFRQIDRQSIRYGGYQIGYSGGHVQVRIDPVVYKRLKAYYARIALRSEARVIEALYHFPFEPYNGVKRQAFNTLREVNRRRKAAGLSQIPKEVIRLTRRPVSAFS